MKDKVVVVTGAAKGLGKSLALECERRGARVIGCDIDSVDITKREQIEDLLTNTVAKEGRVDYWINNAGVWHSDVRFDDLSENLMRKMFEVNAFGTVNGMQVALKQMRLQGFGTIVNIVSTAALHGRPLHSAYAASKYALKGFTDSVREELRGTNIRLVGVYPGGIKTGLFEGSKPAEYDYFMEPDDVAKKIVDNLESAVPEETQILLRPGQDLK